MIYVIINFIRYQFLNSKGTIVRYEKALLPIKPRLNITSLVSQLNEFEQNIFNEWYTKHYNFLKKYYNKITGYRFKRDYPKNNIDKRYVYFFQDILHILDKLIWIMK